VSAASGLRALLVLGLWCAGTGLALAQTRPTPPAAPGPHRGAWEVGGGLVLVGGYDLGDRAAELTRNTGTTTGAFEQFSTESRVTPAAGLQGRIGYYLTNDLVIEGGLRYTKPVLEIDVSGDAEDAPDTTADETLSQYVFDVAAVWHPSGLRFGGGRGMTFLTGGVGYLRELHEGDELVETGTHFHAGGGVKYWFGASRRIGLRAEGGLSFRDGGFDFEDGVRMLPTAGASVVFQF
jgi:hypothetical protein